MNNRRGKRTATHPSLKHYQARLSEKKLAIRFNVDVEDQSDEESVVVCTIKTAQQSDTHSDNMSNQSFISRANFLFVLYLLCLIHVAVVRLFVLPWCMYVCVCVCVCVCNRILLQRPSRLLTVVVGVIFTLLPLLCIYPGNVVVEEMRIATLSHLLCHQSISTHARALIETCMLLLCLLLR